MHSTELIAAVRTAGQLPTADPTYTDARILIELTDMQQQLFERLLVNTRDGHLLQQHVASTVASTSIYRLPARAITQGAERIELAGADGQYHPLTKLTPRQASECESTSEGEPGAFTVRGDSVQLFPTPGSVYSLRVHYYLRPSTLVTAQLPTSGTHRGLITNVQQGTSTVSVNALPFDQLIAVPAAIASGARVDVVRPDGGHEIVLVSALTTFVGAPDVSMAGVALARVQVGDYLRVAEQSDWPQLPPEFHRTLADAAAAAILLSKGVVQKAQALAGKVRSDLERYTDLLNPRVKDQPKVIVPRYGVLRGSRAWRPS